MYESAVAVLQAPVGFGISGLRWAKDIAEPAAAKSIRRASMSKRINFRFARFFAMSTLLLGVQALAQFEVSPDHFDSPAAKQAHHRAAAKTQAKAAPAAAATTQKKATARKAKTAHRQPQTTAALRDK
jgi:hypothetical protein